MLDAGASRLGAVSPYELRLEVRTKLRTCAGCGGRFSGRELFEVSDDHFTFFEGDELCRSCARSHGIL
jgi:hypothetical protein